MSQHGQKDYERMLKALEKILLYSLGQTMTKNGVFELWRTSRWDLVFFVNKQTLEHNELAYLIFLKSIIYKNRHKNLVEAKICICIYEIAPCFSTETGGQFRTNFCLHQFFMYFLIKMVFKRKNKCKMGLLKFPCFPKLAEKEKTGPGSIKCPVDNTVSEQGFYIDFSTGFHNMVSQYWLWCHCNRK